MIILTQDEIETLTGYKQPSLQLNELRRQGFYRARINKRGVIVERSHYHAVTCGTDAPAKKIPSLRLA